MANAPQNKPVIPVKKIIWMKCRASEACEGNEAYATMIFSRSFVQGGGKTVRYRCVKCNGVFSITT